MTALFIFNCFQQSVLEDCHESAIQQVLNFRLQNYLLEVHDFANENF